MNESDLLDKLRRIQTLHDRATTPGERDAAAGAADRVEARLRTLRSATPVEYRFSLHDPWARRLFLALARRHGLRPYRRHRQHRSTLMIRATEAQIDDVLWPEFQELQDTLSAYLDEVTERVIHEAVHADTSEAGVQGELTLGG